MFTNHFANSCAAATQRWFADRRGSSATEYALFLGLVVGGALFGAEFLGLAVRHTFAQAGGAVATRGNSPAAAKPLGLVANPVADVNDQFTTQLQLAVLAGGLLAGAGLWYALYCRNKPRRQASETPPAAEPAESPLPQDTVFKKRQEILNILMGDMKTLFESRVRVEHVMSKRLTAVLPGMPLADVETAMRSGKLRHLLVVDKAERLLGVISDRDLAKPNAHTAAQLMTTKPLTVTPETLLGPAITALVSHRFSCLPVVQDEKLVGLVTTTDLLMTLQCTLQTLHKIAHQVSVPADRTASEHESPELAAVS